jgi:mannosylglycerate hydrolase
MTQKPFTAIMVSETHWDRAWYVPFESFRIRLVRLVDRLIEILDDDPEFRSFMLDGQMLPIEDYLEIRPERRGDLERLVQSGRLVVGPWYALADEYLVSPEALVRNLMVGMRMAESLGGCMREGYVPDAFGHINQLPQILHGVGIESAVFWRGVGDEGEVLGDEFWWQAPDGTRTLTVLLPDGYHNASNLGYPMRWGDTSAMEYDPELALDRLEKAIALLKPRAHGTNLLLMNGIDHAEADPNAPAVIRQANEVLGDVQIEHGTLGQFMNRVRQEADGNLPEFTGEFNRGRYAVILQAVYSTRMYIKQANERVQALLERYAEPLSAWAWSLGTPHPTAFLDRAWRILLKNHPHDDICGCSADPVHRENMVHYNDAEQIAGIMARDGFRAIMKQIDRTAQPNAVPFGIFNPLSWPYTGTAELTLLFDWGDPRAKSFRLVDAAGQEVPCQVIDSHEYFEMEILKGHHKQAVRVAVSLADVPACGYRIYYALPLPAAAEVSDPVWATLAGDGALLENRYLRVITRADGSLEVLDKETGREFTQQAYIEDGEDGGDEYDYSPVPDGETIRSVGRPARIELRYAGPLQAEVRISRDLDLPAALTDDRQRRSAERVTCPLVLTVTLRCDSHAADLRVEVDNRARDHRLRLCFPSGLAVNESMAGGHYDVVRRPIDLPATEGWAQPPVAARHQRGFVDLSDGQVGLAVFNRGLPEYEILRDGSNTIAVTLLRCVGAISRGDLLTRPGHAGVPVPTPEAQCLDQYAFELALRPHAGDWETILPEAVAFQAPLYERRADETEGYLPHEVWAENSPDELTGPATLKPVDLTGPLPSELSFVTLEPAALVLSAVKRAEREDALIVRCYNPSAEPVVAKLRVYGGFSTAQLVNLREEPLAGPFPCGGGSVSFPVAAKRVLTVAFRR